VCEAVDPPLCVVPSPKFQEYEEEVTVPGKFEALAVKETGEPTADGYGSTVRLTAGGALLTVISQAVGSVSMSGIQ